MNFLVQVTIPSLTGLPKDSVTNSFGIIQTTGDGDEFLSDFCDLAASFYDSVPAGGLDHLARCLSPTLSRASNACEVAVYNVTSHLDGSPHGSPEFVQNFTLGAIQAGATALPSEVACVVTLEATGRADALVEAPDGGDAGTAVDRPRQRRTGRLYIGPLNTAALAVVSNVARPSAQVRDTARLAVKDFQAHLQAMSPDVFLAVWSRKDATMRTITDVSTDDAFDTQRRRGEQASARVRTNIL